MRQNLVDYRIMKCKSMQTGPGLFATRKFSGEVFKECQDRSLGTGQNRAWRDEVIATINDTDQVTFEPWMHHINVYLVEGVRGLIKVYDPGGKLKAQSSFDMSPEDFLTLEELATP